VEPITLARKPFPGTVATNVLQHCTGALNIDASRVGSSGGGTQCNNRDENGKCLGHKNAGRSTSGETFHGPNSLSSRWPANLIHDGSDEATQGMGDAARYFYTPKASKLDRDTGCHGLEEKARQTMGNGIGGQPNQDLANNRNHHPTVKPTDLMVYLCRLVTPPGGTVLDPFMGSGSTGRACQILDLSFIGIERDPGYFEIATHRINAPAQQELFA
jgi:site-specific DNA-methyltransferase (adenine-specific)